jgi:hypothetical protein
MTAPTTFDCGPPADPPGISFWDGRRTAASKARASYEGKRHGRIIKRTGDRSIIEFSSVVDASEARDVHGDRPQAERSKSVHELASPSNSFLKAFSKSLARLIV